MADFKVAWQDFKWCVRETLKDSLMLLVFLSVAIPAVVIAMIWWHDAASRMVL